MLSTLFKRATSKCGATATKLASPSITRTFSSTPAASKGKVLIALYPDPVTGYPPKYIRDSIPQIDGYADGTTTPTPETIDFKPGDLLGCVSGELGLRKYLEGQGYEVIVTSDKDGDGCEMDKHLPEAEIIISQPFYPYYVTAERMAKAPNLKAAITAGIGSDHVDLEAAISNNVDVSEVTFCNSISVSEHVVMMILGLVRNYIPSHDIVRGDRGCGWNVADCVQRAYDVEGMSIGTVAAGRIGLAVLRRMHPFGCKLHYTDRHRLPAEVEKELNLTYHESAEDMLPHLDVVTINCPLHPETEHMINESMINKMKRGVYVINTARGKICDKDAIAKALEDGRLGGYAGDVWFPQPPPKDHPWRYMPWNGMTPHTSGTTLSAQTRYAAGVREILEDMEAGKEIRSEYQIVTNGKLAGVGAHSYSEGNATGGSETAVGTA